MKFDSTICAISTASGNGAIAIIRLSGEKSFEIIDEVFVAKSGKRIQEQAAYSIHFGEIRNNEELLDEVLVSVFKAPNSYTGENSVEISCHGSIYIQQKILELLIKNGAQMAEPGEYTMRAFLNGKMDLSQAEAVSDVIASRSKASHQIAINQMRGGFSLQIKRLREQLLSLVSLIELELDFSEEDIEFADRTQLSNILIEVKVLVEKLVQSFELGNAIKNGIPIAIIGEPNVGKSTLLNVLLNENKAIVSDIPGTTRDVIEDVININGILYRFIDTAGIRKTEDTIEKLGIERTYEKIKQAQIVLLLLDAKDKIDSQIEKINFVRDNIQKDSQNLIILQNKIDQVRVNKGKANLNLHKENEYLIEISAKESENIDLLLHKLTDLVLKNRDNEEDTIVSNVRHFEALSKVKEGVERIDKGLSTGLSNDFLAQDVREVLHYLGEITGEITTDEILGNIFQNFCIGK
jgi:tRNA modification GTPase